MEFFLHFDSLFNLSINILYFLICEAVHIFFSPWFVYYLGGGVLYVNRNHHGKCCIKDYEDACVEVGLLEYF